MKLIMLQERIQLMFDSNQVDAETYEKTPALLEMTEQFISMKLTEDNAGAYTSHLMKAIERVKTNQAITSCSPALVEQATANASIFSFALQLLSPFNPDHINLEAEAAFIAAYLIGITEEEELN